MCYLKWDFYFSFLEHQLVLLVDKFPITSIREWDIDDGTDIPS